MRFYHNSATCSSCILRGQLLLKHCFIPMVLAQDAMLVLMVFLISLKNLSSNIDISTVFY